MTKIFFITGVNGVGKSAIIPHLKDLLPKDKYEIHDFDEREVPANADSDWRISEIRYWIDVGVRLGKINKSIVVCGFVKTKDFGKFLDNPDIKFIFLDARPEIICQRLKRRYTKNGIFDESQTVIGKPINEFIESNVYIAKEMRKNFEDLSSPIIDTSDLPIEKVAKRIVELVGI